MLALGVMLTMAIVIAILGYSLLRSNTSTATATGLADPNALNPNPSLLAVGSKAPDFTLRDVAGRPFHLAAQRGHPVLLEFFATWCPVCQAEAPALAKVTLAYVPKNVQIWAILANPYGQDYESSGRTDLRLADRHDLSWYARTFKVSHPQLIDPSFATVNQYGAKSYPTIYVVNSKGIITFANSGREPYAVLAKELNKALKG